MYTRIPQRILFNSEPERLNIGSISDTSTNNYDTITIIFPGAGGPDKNTDDLLESITNYNNKNNIKRSYTRVYDWKKWRGNLLRAAQDSISVGKIIGNDVATYNVNNVHFIGVSVGAFAADTASKIVKRKLKDTTVKVTLLDPFCSLGVLRQRWGNKYFGGKDIDFCEQYLNTDDPVPFTNEPLPNCYCYDITDCKDRYNFIPLPNDNMHSWPTYYYAKNYNKLNSKKDKENHDRLPRGNVIKVQ